MAERFICRAVLFDLDGTLADTAVDLGGAVNRLLAESGRPALPLEALRPYVSQGVRGLLRKAYGSEPDDPGHAALSDRFLVLYEKHICDESTLFPGMAETLLAIEQAGLPWGIVTNKRSRFTGPVMAGLGLSTRAACQVSGDTTPEPKPSPLPILHACQLVGVDPRHSLYIGDDQRDIEAGRAAGCRTVAVRWGYLGDGGPIESWGADHIIDHPADLLPLISPDGVPTA